MDEKQIYQGHNDFIDTEVKYQGGFEQKIDKCSDEAYTYQGGNDFVQEGNFTGWI